MRSQVGLCRSGELLGRRQLIENDLADEYRILLEPVVLGGGKPLFPDDGWKRPLELVSTTTAGTETSRRTLLPRPTELVVNSVDSSGVMTSSHALSIA